MQAQLAGLKFNREWLVFRRGDSRIARIATRHTRTVKNPVITRKARSISNEVIYLIPPPDLWNRWMSLIITAITEKDIITHSDKI